ncbi:MAG: 3-hydroxybutyrate dehydrogenase [Rubrivivax sp.]|nr:3-hydroxybutyrate dehydrogenase [Rubrivivax sp.]
MSHTTSERRCALVTGATQGIGLAIAERLAAAGHDLVLHGIEPDEAGATIAARVAAAAGVRAAYVRADLADAEAAAGLVTRASAALRSPDVLVNNAGIQHTSPIESFPIDRWHAIVAINLSAAFFTMRAAVPAMRSRGFGRIVNIASVHGLVASVNKAAYLAAKHGVVGLSKGVALETAAQGITVNCICPGWTDTPIIAPQIEARAAQFGGDRAAGIRELLREKQPNLTLLPPARIGDVAVFLASDAAAGITGIALPVDGGWTAQ